MEIIKNSKIIAFDTLKFLLAICIVGHHIFCNAHVGEYFHCADLAVEGFFMLSGFFLAKSFYNIKDINSIDKSKEFFSFFIKKIKQVYPTFLFCGLLNFLLRNIFSDHITSKTFMLNLAMMGNWGGIASILNGSWYLIVYFWLSLFLYYLLLYHNDKAKIFYIPFLTIILLFYFINNGNHIYGHSQVIFNLISAGTVRGLLGLCCGIITFEITNIVKTMNIKIRYIDYILLILEVLFSVLIFKYIILNKNYSVADFNIYFYFGYIISLIYLQKEKFLKFLNLKIWGKISYISYTLYLTHFIIVEFVLNRINLKLSVFSTYFIYIIGSILFAYICYYMQKIVFYYMKKVFIINNGLENGTK